MVPDFPRDIMRARFRPVGPLAAVTSFDGPRTVRFLKRHINPRVDRNGLLEGETEHLLLGKGNE